MRLVCKERPLRGCCNPRENFPMLPRSTTFTSTRKRPAASPLRTVANPMADSSINHCLRFASKISLVNAFMNFALIWPSLPFGSSSQKANQEPPRSWSRGSLSVGAELRACVDSIISATNVSRQGPNRIRLTPCRAGRRTAIAPSASC
jgi:hypothetical protein